MEETCGDVLLLGEGDFSFSVAFASKFLKDHKGYLQVTSTSYLGQQEVLTTHKNAECNIKLIQNLGVQVFHSVDATNVHLHPSLLGQKFDRIFFNFPHTGGKSNIKKNRKLLKDFFESVIHIMKERGEILLSLCRGQGGTPVDIPVRAWHDSWQAVGAAAYVDLVLHRVEPFDPSDWREYDCTGFRGEDRNFFTGGALTYFFVKSPQVFVGGASDVEALVECEVEGQTVLVNQYIASKLKRNLLESKCGPLNVVIQELEEKLRTVFQDVRVNNIGLVRGKILSKPFPVKADKVPNQMVAANEKVCAETDCEGVLKNATNDAFPSHKITPSVTDIEMERHGKVDFHYYVEKVASQENESDIVEPTQVDEQNDDNMQSVGQKNQVLRSMLRTTLLDYKKAFDSVRQHKVVTACGDVYRRFWINNEELPVQHEFLLLFEDDSKDFAERVHERVYNLSKSILPHASISVSNATHVPLYYSQYLNDVKYIEAGYKSENVFHTLSCNQVKSKGPATVNKEGFKSSKLSKIIGYMGTLKKEIILCDKNSEILKNVVAVIFITDGIAQVKFDIPDPRLLWSGNVEYLNQFEKFGKDTKMETLLYKPVSYYPPLWRHDLSFWERKDQEFNEQRFLDIVRNIGRDSLVEVILMNVWRDPESGRVSKCYRQVYQSHDSAISHSKAHEFQNAVRLCVADKMGVELR